MLTQEQKTQKATPQKKVLCQTELIKALIANGCIKSTDVTNASRYLARTSKGIFEGTDVHYFAKLGRLQRKLDTTTSKMKSERIYKDITAIEEGYLGERAVQAWFAIPPNLEQT